MTPWPDIPAPAGSRRFAFDEARGALWHFPTVPGARRHWFLHEADWALPAGLATRRLARAVRQDLWRALRHLRGFWPVVRIAPSGIGAGGFAPAPWTAAHRARIAGLFNDTNRAAWLRHARRGGNRCSRRS